MLITTSASNDQLPHNINARMAASHGLEEMEANRQRPELQPGSDAISLIADRASTTQETRFADAIRAITAHPANPGQDDAATFDQLAFDLRHSALQAIANGLPANVGAPLWTVARPLLDAVYQKNPERASGMAASLTYRLYPYDHYYSTPHGMAKIVNIITSAPDRAASQWPLRYNLLKAAATDTNPERVLATVGMRVTRSLPADAAARVGEHLVTGLKPQARAAGTEQQRQALQEVKKSSPGWIRRRFGARPQPPEQMVALYQKVFKAFGAS